MSDVIVIPERRTSLSWIYDKWHVTKNTLLCKSLYWWFSIMFNDYVFILTKGLTFSILWVCCDWCGTLFRNPRININYKNKTTRCIINDHSQIRTLSSIFSYFFPLTDSCNCLCVLIIQVSIENLRKFKVTHWMQSSTYWYYMRSATSLTLLFRKIGLFALPRIYSEASVQRILSPLILFQPNFQNLSICLARSKLSGTRIYCRTLDILIRHSWN